MVSSGIKRLSFIALFFFILSPFKLLIAAPHTLEALHWWTTGPEANSLKIIKSSLKKEGITWKDHAVAGSPMAMTVLKSRILSGKPPELAQIKGPRLQEMASEKLLVSINEVAKQEKWDSKIPPALQKTLQYKGEYVGIPFNVHRGNWMWVNLSIFEKAKARIPTTWEMFFVEAEKIKKAGFIPLALGGERWQESALFETVLLSYGDDLYKKFFISQDASVFKEPGFEKALITFRRLKQLTDQKSVGRSWDMTLLQVLQNKAAVQIMGDWARAEFDYHKKIYGKDYLCVPAPGTEKHFTFVVDSFAFLKQSSTKLTNAQLRPILHTILSPETQEEFSLIKGSIPIVPTAHPQKFDACSRQSMKDFAMTSTQEKLLPSFAFGMTLPAELAGQYEDILGQYFHQSSVKSEDLQKDSKKVIHDFQQASLNSF
jgi:glucose/mannose transport system substrate-binding protein